MSLVLLRILQVIPGLGKDFRALEDAWFEIRRQALELRVEKDKRDIDSLHQLRRANEAMKIEDARAKARKLREIFRS